jgi:hypothetical protein
MDNSWEVGLWRVPLFELKDHCSLSDYSTGDLVLFHSFLLGEIETLDDVVSETAFYLGPDYSIGDLI